MGLDMYLYAERYVNEYLSKGDDIKEESIRNEFPELKDFRITKVFAEVGYWRKANAIHKWFVENVQDGVDDCGTYNVTRDKLNELLLLVKEVITTKRKSKKKNKSVATSILPTGNGFFFGSTDIDEHYYAYMKRTVEILEKVIELPNIYNFKYSSSW